METIPTQALVLHAAFSVKKQLHMQLGRDSQDMGEYLKQDVSKFNILLHMFTAERASCLIFSATDCSNCICVVLLDQQPLDSSRSMELAALLQVTALCSSVLSCAEEQRALQVPPQHGEAVGK